MPYCLATLLVYIALIYTTKDLFHPSNIDCQFRTLIGDGFCQDYNNNRHCSFDGGDCCGPCVNREFCTECKCKTGYTNKITNAIVGNGFCNDETNIEVCNFDGGDCCGTCVNSKYCSECGEFVKNNNVQRQPEYKDLILFQVKDGN